MNFKGRTFPFRLRCAGQGIAQAWLREASFRLQTLAAVFALGSLFFLHPPLVWAVLVIILVCFVLAMELVNTAVEYVLDGLHPEEAEFVRIAKDCAAGAVLVSSMCALAVYIMMLIALMRHSG